MQFLEYGYPNDFETPLRVECLNIYPLDQINQRQAGYRFNANTSMAEDDWEKSHWVISDQLATQ